MYARSLQVPAATFFLGPRGCGKSTWLRHHLTKFHRIDLLRTDTFLRYQQNPALLRSDVEALPHPSWVSIDEVQKLPELLDEVHAILEDFKGKYRFALTGSSARKLKRENVNLLAGRALTESLFPFIANELGSNFDLEDSLKFGNLPAVVTAGTAEEKARILESYTETYLREEIQQEAAVKNLASFARFLRVAALANGQKVDVTALARDTGVQRSTVQGYFQILSDTLLGTLLQPWPLKFRVKEVDHPKFYFFDTGVVRTLLNYQREPLERADRGFIFETWFFHELQAYNRYHHIGGEFYFWSTHSGPEVDFIYSRGKKAVGFELKAGTDWRPEYCETLQLLIDEGKLKRGIGVYTGTRKLKVGDVEVWPAEKFLEGLHSGKEGLF